MSQYIYRKRWRIRFRWPVFIQRWDEDLTEPDWDEEDRRMEYHMQSSHNSSFAWCAQCELRFGRGPARKLKA